MMRLREGMLWRPVVIFLAPPLPGLSMTFRLRMIRPLLTSRGLTLRFRMRTVSEKGETCMRDGKPPGLEKVDAMGSERGRGRLDIRWQRWMSFFSLWVAARELSFGVGAMVEEDAEGNSRAEAAEEGVARPEEERGVVWRPPEALLLGSRLGARAFPTKFLGFGPRFFGPFISLSRSFCSKPSSSLSSRIFSSGSQVLCFIAHPFHLTRNSILPLRTRRFSIASAAKMRSPVAECSIVSDPPNRANLCRVELSPDERRAE